MVRVTSTRLISMSALAAALAFAAPVSAQSAEAQPASDVAAAESDGIDEIVVTAARREQALQDVPISVAVLSGEELSTRNADDLGSYIATVPGIGFADFGSTGNRDFGGAQVITIRGITQGSGGPAYGFYLDESPILFSDPRLYDISRVEVLRGPQGTLYGRGTSGGAIKIVTNQPDPNNWSGKIAGTVMSVHKGEAGFRAHGVINIPIATDVAALRVVAYRHEEPGYVDLVELPVNSPSAIPGVTLGQALGPQYAANSARNVAKDVNDVDITGVRITGLFEPADWLRIKPMFSYERIKVASQESFDPFVGDLQKSRAASDLSMDATNKLYSLDVQVGLGFANFTSITTFGDYKQSINEEAGGFIRGTLYPALFGPAAPLVGGLVPAPSTLDILLSVETFVQEARIASTGSGRWQWLAGVYYEKTRRSDLDRPSLVGTTPGLGGVLAGFGIGGFTDQWAVTFNDIARTKELSFFGETSFDITDRLTATLGARHFDVDSLARGTRSGLAFGVPNATTTPTGAAFNNKGTRGKAAISYKLSDSTNIYGSWAQGFRRGGANPILPVNCQAEFANQSGGAQPPDQFEADTITNYEVGAKGSFAKGRVNVNLSAYYIDWSDFQLGVTLQCGSSFTINAGQAESKGFEMEMSVKPAQNLDLSLALGYTDAKFTDITTNLAIIGSDLAPGQRLPNVPRMTLSTTAQYTKPLGGGRYAFVRGEYFYNDERLGAPGGLQGTFDSYNLVNLRAGFGANNWSIVAFVENLADERPVLGAGDFGTGRANPEAFTLRPRTIGASFDVKF